MIDVAPITPWVVIKMLCTDKVVAEFNDILFKSNRETFELIQEYFNKKNCLEYEKSEEVKACK